MNIRIYQSQKNINVATEEDFEEAREVMSGEYSNLPVSKEVSAN